MLYKMTNNNSISTGLILLIPTVTSEITDINMGVLGIDYQEVSKIVNNSDTDWTYFMKEDSDGLTKTGQKLLQLAIESYVYCDFLNFTTTEHIFFSTYLEF